MCQFRFQFRDLGPRSQKISQIQVLDLRFRSQVLENDLELGSKAWKLVLQLRLNSQRSPQLQVVFGPRFRSQVLENVLDLGFQVQDLGPRFQKVSQIQVLCTQKKSQIYVLSYWKMSKNYVLCLRFRSYVLENDLDLRPKAWSWSYN